MLFKSILVASALAALASAQIASTTVSQSMPPTATAGFNPGNVSSTEASQWCQAQQNTCPQICGSTLNGYASTNQCDPTSFTYTCICGNGTEPDCTAYMQTLPYYICQATYSQCVNNHPNDLVGQGNCKTAEVCGSKNATALEAVASAASSSASSATSAAASKTSAAASKASSAASSASAAATSSAAAAPVQQQLATGAFAAVLLAAFKLFL